MYIVLDGIDGCGKTSIAREIARIGGYVQWKHLNGPEHQALNCAKFASRNNGPFEDMLTARLLKSIGSFSVVQDRGLWASKIYPRYQGQPALPWLAERHYWNELIPVNTLYVWIDRPVAECRLERFGMPTLEYLHAQYRFEYDACILPSASQVYGGSFPAKLHVSNGMATSSATSVARQILEVVAKCS